MASFLAQNYEGQKELLIYNDKRSKLLGSFPGVKVFNVAKPIPESQAKNFLINQASGSWLISLSENDVMLPNFLQSISDGIDAGSDWVWLEKEIIYEHGNILKIGQASTSSFAFTKASWQKVGKFKLNGNPDRHLVGIITRDFKGNRVAVEDSLVSLIHRSQQVGMLRMANGDRQIYPLSKEDYASVVKNCLQVRAERRVCVVLLCKYGDIICILPILRRMSEQGLKVYLMVHVNFAPLLEGVSYVVPRPVSFNANDVSTALATARREFEIVFNAQIWGKGLKRKRECSSFNEAMWRSLGCEADFSDSTMRPLFDRRDLDREAKLIADHIPSGKPYILVNFKSQSSPCPACAGLLEAIQERWGDLFSIIDLAKITAHRLYDFIGMMEKASALVTVDTAFLHLAAATNVPIVALCNPRPWLGSTPRGNVVARLTYMDVAKDYEVVQSSLGRALAG